MLLSFRIIITYVFLECNLEWLILFKLNWSISWFISCDPICSKINGTFISTIPRKLVHTFLPCWFSKLFSLLSWHLLSTSQMVIVLSLFHTTNLLWLWEAFTTSIAICEWSLKVWTSRKLLVWRVHSICICRWCVLCKHRFSDWWLLIVVSRWSLLK